ncbi:MAG TPA: PQQ-dependent sugar dehydrogenase [Terriglobales bacterium]|nr:PQQ-dependent sugar dehydrogenase [Terriglobales bacterium]
MARLFDPGSVIKTAVFSALAVVIPFAFSQAQNPSFHNAPESSRQMNNPYVGQQNAAAGKRLYSAQCARCHGPNAEGSGNIPALVDGVLESVSDGEIFWFTTKGDKASGMPSFAKLPEQQRWQLVTYVKNLGLSQTSSTANAVPEAAAMVSKIKAPPPTPPFTDFRYEQPGRFRKITVNDLPQAYATASAENGPDVVARPASAWPKAPAGFKVELYAEGLENPRLMRTAPNGDVFLAESRAGRIRVFRGTTGDGKAELSAIFAGGLKRPYGIAFYPPGQNPQWIYIGTSSAVFRFAYHNGDLKASGSPEHIADLPDTEGHWTRDIQFSPDGKKMFVGVGSRSNDDDTDNNPDEKNRANILQFNPDGSDMQVYAYGIRNPGGGLAINPKTGELWCSVNERDALGDNLVPDYITHVQPGGFYGWPWWYLGAHQDPRQKGKHPELKDKVIVPDVLLQAHNASLEFTFYEGKQFPAEYQGDIFASEHGSWNRSVRAGYEVIRVPLHQSGHASGEYEDFVTGFVLDDGQVWGRPVGITVASDGSLLVSDDGSNSIWRVSYTGN